MLGPWSTFTVRPIGAVTRGLNTKATTVGLDPGLGILIIGLTSSFSRVSPANLFRRYYLLHRVASSVQVVLASARV